MISGVSAPLAVLHERTRSRPFRASLTATHRPSKNASLYSQVLDWASGPAPEAGPLAGLHHQQSAWYAQVADPAAVTGCRTCGCVAAAAIILAGGYFTNPYRFALHGHLPYGRAILPGRAAPAGIPAAARDLLGLTMAEAQWLFHSSRPLADLHAAWPYFRDDKPFPHTLTEPFEAARSWHGAAAELPSERAGWDAEEGWVAPSDQELVSA